MLNKPDPSQITWDPTPTPVAPSSGGRGGVIITDPSVAQKAEQERIRTDIAVQGAGVSAASEARQTAANTWRDLTPEELAARPQLAGGVYQINGLGEIRTIKEAKKTAPTAEMVAELKGLSTGLDQFEADLVYLEKQYPKLFENQGLATPAEFLPTPANRAFDDAGTRLLPLVAKALGYTAKQMDTPAEIERLKTYVPQSWDSDTQIEEKLTTLRGMLERQRANVADQLGETVPNVPSETEARAAQGGQPTIGAGEAGEKFLTGDDLRVQEEVNKIFQTATLDEVNALLGKLRPGSRIALTPEEFAERQKMGDFRFVITPTGTREDASDVLGISPESATGAYAIAAANALSAGLMDEALGQMGYDAQTIQAAKEAAREGSPVASIFGDVTGGILQSLVAPGGRLAGAALAGREAALGAAYGAGEANEDRLTGGAIGGAFGAALPAAMAARTAMRPAAAPRSNIVRGADEAVAAGQRENVPVLTTDVAPPRTWLGKWTQGLGEKLPVVGTAKLRADQQAAREGMIEDLFEQYNRADTSIDDVTADFMATRGNRIGKLKSQKDDVFARVANAGDVPVSNTLRAIDEQIAELARRQTPEAGDAIRVLQGIRSQVEGRDIIAAEAFRADVLSNAFKDVNLSAGASDLVSKATRKLYDPFRRDMGNFIRANGGEQQFAKWQAANKELADFADDLEKNTVKRLLATGEATPEEASTLLFSKNPSDVKSLMKNLSPKGQARARSLVVMNIIEKAGGIEAISTANFTKALRQSAKTFGVVFPKAEADRMVGMLRLMQVTKRAEQAAVNTPTGQLLLPFAGAGVGASGLGFLGGGWAGAAGAGAVSAAAFRLFESAPMRNLMMSLGRVEPGGAAEGNILSNVAKLAAKYKVPQAVVRTQAAQSQSPDMFAEPDMAGNAVSNEVPQ